MEASGSKTPIVNLDEDTPSEPVVNLEEERQETVEQQKDVRAKKSWVWDHFTEDKDSGKSKCHYCNSLLASGSKKNGTSSLSHHLKFVCLKSPTYKKADTKQSILSFKPKSFGESSGNLASHKFSQEECRILLARMCIKDNQPFSIVEDEGFREYSWGLNPMFKFPSRWTVARDCWKIFREEKKTLKNTLKDQTLSLTTDTWTSCQNFNYMCLTAHWVDDDWVLRKKIINFCQIPNHKGQTIGKYLYQCLQEWGIDRVLTVTVDNASSNDGAIRYLKKMLKGPHALLDCKYLHLRCNAHIINLVVKDGLEEQIDSISRIRNAVRYLRSSSQRYLSFKESVEKEKIACKRKPCLDIETRWNSTFLMLETALVYEKAFDRLQDVDYSYRSFFRSEDEDDAGSTRKRKKSDKVLGAPNTSDWEKARLFMEFLRIFFNVTKKISGSKYVTANILFGELCTMHATIVKMSLSSNESEKKMAQSMKAKYEKYWENLANMNLLLYVALVLDPRNKMHYLDYCLELIYGENSKEGKEIVDQVEKALVQLFNAYKMKMDKSVEKKNTFSSSDSNDGEKVVDLEDGYLKYLEKKCGRGANTSELDIYLRDGTEKMIKGDDTFDVLGWWKLNSKKFPVLSQLARHVLGMPISTVASESAFSTGGRVIDKYRSSLTPKTAESLICLQDWIRTTPKGLQDTQVHGLQLQDLLDNLEKIEQDLSPENRTIEDSCIEDEDEDEDWE